jgi:hypothetical protein
MNIQATANWFKIRKIAIGVLLGCFALWVLTSAWVGHSDFAHLPKLPEESTGRVNRIFVSGGTRYGSEQEAKIFILLENLRPIAFLCFIVALAVGLALGDLKIAPGRKLNE